MGFGFGGGLVLDPAVMKMPVSPGTLFWGGIYGHGWFVDPVKKITFVLFTNTAAGGKVEEFHLRLRDAVYEES